MLFKNLFPGVDVDELKDSNRGDWETGSDLQTITTNLRLLNTFGYSDLTINSDTTYTEDIEVNDLYIYNNGRLNAPGYNVIVLGDLIGRNARIVCDRLIVCGNIDIKRKTGDTSYSNILDVDEIFCSGNMDLDYTEWSPDFYYEGVGAGTGSTTIQKVGGNLTITNPLNTDWLVSRLNVSGDFACDSSSLIHWDSYSVEKSFLWTIDGDCEFPNLTSLTIKDCYVSPKLSIGGSLTFGQAAVTIDLSGSDGLSATATAGSTSPAGGGYIQGSGVALDSNGSPGTYNGGGSGANAGSIIRYGGTGAGRGGDGGSTLANGLGRGGGGGGGAPDFTMYYGSGDVDTTLTITLKGGAGGDGNIDTTVGVSADGGDGGDSGDLVIGYDSVSMNVLNMDVTAASGGSGAGTGSSGSSGSVGTSSHTSGQTPLAYHLPKVPSFVTVDFASTSTIEFNVPVDLNGSDLDFSVELEQMLTNTVWLDIYNHDSNNDSGYFSGTAPYTEGTGTVIYTPPTLESGKTYRIRIAAMKDSDTDLLGINSEWLTFTYP